MVCCANCGLLGLRPRLAQSLIQIPSKMRRSWSDQLPSDEHSALTDGRPYCAAEAFTAHDHTRLDSGRVDETKDVIHGERVCAKFFQVVLGREPAWHQDQAMAVEVQKNADERQEKERRWMEQQKDADRKAREEDKEADRKYQESQKATEREYQREQADRLADKAFRRQFITIIASALFGSLLTGIVGWLATMNGTDKKPPPTVIEKKTEPEK
jgi:hypothetical protein